MVLLGLNTVHFFVREGTPQFNCFRIEYKYNDTKMKPINMKHGYILPHFIQFKKSFFYRASPMAASGHLHYFLSLVFLTSFSPFRSHHWKCSIKKVVLKVLNMESLFNDVQDWRATTLLNRDSSNTGVRYSYGYSCLPIAIE